jgi:stage II sporulation protein D
MTRNLRAIPLVLALVLSLTASAHAASRFTIRGAGFGHGVGMSQYGALGYAQHGWDYKAILAHYYTGTGLGVLRDNREVRVLMQSTRGMASFVGASSGAGRLLNPSATYYARGRAGGQVELLGPRKHVLETVAAPLRVTGTGLLTLRGRAGNGRTNSSYRGALEFRPGAFGGINAINAVGVDDYVQGVIPVESPASWPAEALKAQAVAARTYALATSKGGAGFEQYPDTRSQVYGGAGVETAATNAATQATAGQLVTYQGTPVATYFFSTSGGRTEDVENTALGTVPKPWLTSVEDKYDSVSPRHRWGPIRMSGRAAGRKLSGFVRGSFKGIKVVKRGASPRVMAADVIGSRGRIRVSGAVLRSRFGLYDSWAYFTSISTGKAPAVPADPPTTTGPDTGGTGPVPGTAARRKVPSLAGTIIPAQRGARVVVERHIGGLWLEIATGRVGRGGRYRVPVPEKGVYRVRIAGAAGPTVRLR